MPNEGQYSRVDVYRSSDGEQRLYLCALDVFYRLHCFRYIVSATTEKGSIHQNGSHYASEKEEGDVVMERMWSVPLPLDDVTLFRREAEEEGEEEEEEEKSSKLVGSTPPSPPPATTAPVFPARVAAVRCASAVDEAVTVPCTKGAMQARAKVEVDWFIKDAEAAEETTNRNMDSSYTPLRTLAEPQAGVGGQFIFLQSRKDVLATVDVSDGTCRHVHPYKPKASAPSSSPPTTCGESGDTQLSFKCMGTVNVVTMMSTDDRPPEQFMQWCDLTFMPAVTRGNRVANAVSVQCEEENRERCETYFFQVQSDLQQGDVTARLSRTEKRTSKDPRGTSSLCANALLLSFVLAVEGDGFGGRCQLYPVTLPYFAATVDTVPTTTLAPSVQKSLSVDDEGGSLYGALVPWKGSVDDVLLYLPCSRDEDGDEPAAIVDENDEEAVETTTSTDGSDDDDSGDDDDDDDDSLQDLDDLYGRAPRRTDSCYSYTYSAGSSAATHVDRDPATYSTPRSALSSCSRPVTSSAPFFHQMEDDSSDGGRQSSALVPTASPLRQTTSPLTESSGDASSALFYSFFDDNFEPLSFLGKGAGGAVLLARHKLTNQFFAIKVLIVTNYQSEKEVLKEVRVHASLNSYNYNNTSNVGNVVYRRPALLMDTAAEAEEKEEDGTSGVTADGRNVLQFYNCWSEAVSRDRARQLYEVGILSKTEAGLQHAPAAKHADRTWSRFPSRPHQKAWVQQRSSAAVNNAIALVGEESFSSLSDPDSERESTSEEEEEEEEEEDDNAPSLPVCAHGDEEGLANGVCVPYRPSKRANGGDRGRGTSFVGSRVVFLQMELCQMTLGRFLAERAEKINDRCAERSSVTGNQPRGSSFSLYNRIENLIILLQIGKGLLYLHEEKHVLHRDLKPMNVFLDFHCQTALLPQHPATSLSPSDTLRSTNSTGEDSVTPGSFSDITRSVNSSQRPSPFVAHRDTDPIFTGDDGEAEHACGAVACVAAPVCASSSLLPPETTTPLSSGAVPTHAHHQYIYQHAFKGIGMDDKVFTTRMSPSDDNRTSEQERSERMRSSKSDAGSSKYNHGSRGHDHRLLSGGKESSEEKDEERLKAEMVNFILNFKYYSIEELLPLCRARRRSRKGTEQQLQQTTAWYMETLLNHYTQVRIGDLGLAKMLPLIAPLSSSGSSTADEMREKQEGADPSQHDALAAAKQRPYNFYTAADNLNTEGAGSPMYASPEQLCGRPCTAAADLFSLGMIAVELYVAPTTIAERLRVLQDARDGHFEALCRHHRLPPTTETLFTVFPELRLAAACLAPEPRQRTSLTEFLVRTEDILKECVHTFIDAC